MTRKAISFCRACGASCGVRLTIADDQRIVDVHGDKAQPLSLGYLCFKGTQAEEMHHGPDRLLHPMRRSLNGSFERTNSSTAFDEIALQLRDIIARDGPDAVAVMAGTMSYMNTTGHTIYKDFLRAIGSEQNFSVATIDQSAKIVSYERLGAWGAGVQDLDLSDVVLLIGTNPVVAHTTNGLMTTNPTRRIKEAKARGVKFICIDPRRTESAHYADLVLQPLPGNDAAIVAALIRIILEEGWHDAEFCARHVGHSGLDRLREAVAPFEEAFVERRADLQPGQIRSVAELFARDNKRGAAFTATGPSMGPFSNLMQHLVDTLNVICGRVRRAGDRAVVNPREPQRAIYAEVVPPSRSWLGKPPSRIRGVRHLIGGERMSGTLADEILTPGQGQIRALIVDGGNPVQCMPDQRHVIEAFKSLELLVVIEPRMTATARLAHYIIPPKLPYERADLPIYAPGYPLQHDSYQQYTPAVITPPNNSNVVDAWRVYWEIAARLGVQIAYDGRHPLNMRNAPSTDDLLALSLHDAAVGLKELQQFPSGKIFDLPHSQVQPARPGNDGRFDVMPDDVAEECLHLQHSTAPCDGQALNGRAFTHLLSSRRLRDVLNSIGTTLPSTRTRLTTNPAFLNPNDMLAFGLHDGEPIAITSAHGSVQAVVQSDPDLRPGVINLAHGWGGLPDDDGPGTCVNLLTDDATDVQSINAMPRMSCVPVNIEKLASDL